ncbi:glycosyltransferase family 4 protein [candidate division KSB1 bacterium]|nr:glycosyltransferase family 4 protein [candidate division KSB1 bacterium]
MKVLMIAPQPWFSPRGTPFSVLHRLRAISRLGHEVDLLTYHIGQDVPIENVKIHRIPQIPLIKKIAVGPSLPKAVLDFFILMKARKLVKQNHYDLLHTHEEAGFMAPMLLKKRKMRHLYDMHSSLPQQLTNCKFTTLRSLISTFEKLERMTIESADAVITICPELYHYVERLFPDKFNMLIENVADNGEVFEHKPVSPEEIKNRFNLNNHTILVYAGTFVAYQGLDLLIKSSEFIIRQNAATKIILVGGNDDQVKKYRKMVDDLNLTDHFVFTGTVQPQEVPDYEGLADVLVSPRIEGNNTPLKIYSYLRSGKPIVATRHLTHTQVLDDSVSILTDCTPEAFAEGVLKAIRDRELTQEIIRNAQKLAEEKYSYRVYLEKTKTIYDFIMDKLD